MECSPQYGHPDPVRAPQPAPGALTPPPDPGHVLESLPDGLLVADASARVCYVNPRAAQLLGRRREHLLAEPIRSVLPLYDDAGRSWWDCLDPWGGLHTRTGHRERTLLVPGVGRVLVTMRFVRETTVSRRVDQVIVSIRDSEARRRAEAEEAELISLVAHEVRAPLNSVLGFSGTLLRRWTRFSDEQKQTMVRTVADEAQRLGRLIHELLDVSRIDSDRLRITPRPTDLREVIGQHLQRLISAGEPAERFLWSEAEQGPRMVWADPDRLDQILANLLENALRHGDGRVLLATKENDGMVAATVADEGSGVPPEHYALVFGKFWHGSRAGSTGLGLYLVRGLVEAHGGTVSVGRADCGGALFRFTLPAVAGSVTAPTDRTLSDPASSGHASSGRAPDDPSVASEQPSETTACTDDPTSGRLTE